MIVYNAAAGQFQSVGGNRPFHAITYFVAGTYAQWLSILPTLASPQDIIAANGPVGMHLCHHVSFQNIEAMVVSYLNGQISLNQFMILVGSLTRPTWTHLSFPPTLLLLLFQWALGMVRRFQLLYEQIRGNPVGVAQAANQLVSTLNNAITNLRYGHRTTNLSIGQDADLRLHRGLTLDPIMIVNIFVGWIINSPVYSAESSAQLNDWEQIAMATVPMLPGGQVKTSESGTVVGHTGTGNPLVGVGSQPMRDVLHTRGSARIWLPVSFDSALYFIGVYLLALVMGWVDAPL